MLLRALTGEDVDDPSRWPLYRSLLPHCVAVDGVDPTVARIHQQMALWCMRTGLFLDAEHLLRRSLAAHAELLGTEDRTTLWLRSVLAVVLGMRGHGELAKAELRAVLTEQRRLFGAEDDDVGHTERLVAEVEEAYATEPADDRAGRAAVPSTEEELRALLAERVRVLGVHHPDALVAHCHLVALLLEQERAEECQREARELLPTVESALGRDHPMVASVRETLTAVESATPPR